MSWQDRDYGDDPSDRIGRPGGDWRGVRPTFENPMSWSIPFGSLAGIVLRIHIIFLIYIAIELIQALLPSKDLTHTQLSPSLTLTFLVSLFVVVLLHELGHCIACRTAGGNANEILMWPLGGLAYCLPRNAWVSHFVTVIGGPVVNVVICLTAGLTIGFMTGVWIGGAIPGLLLTIPDGLHNEAWPVQALFLLHLASYWLLLFNLLPIFPLDGGRIVQSLLWPRVGYARSMRIAVYAGYIGAILLGIFGAVRKDVMLVGIAVFGGVTCYMTLRQMQFTQEFMGVEDDAYSLSLTYGQGESQDDAAELSRKAKHEARQQEKAEATRREIDRILAKIADSGIESLTYRERRLLKQETRRRQSKEP